MAKTPEKIVKDKVIDALKGKGVWYFLPTTGGYGRSGVPDILACVNGRFVGIECKAGKGKATALQLREMERINACGGIAFIVNEDNCEQVPIFLQNLMETSA